jgi:hypothetical protein
MLTPKLDKPGLHVSASQENAPLIAEPERLLTADVAADWLGITKARLYELSRLGKVPTVRLGRSFRYSPGALRAFIEHGGEGLSGGWRKERAHDGP